MNDTYLFLGVLAASVLLVSIFSPLGAAILAIFGGVAFLVPDTAKQAIYIVRTSRSIIIGLLGLLFVYTLLAFGSTLAVIAGGLLLSVIVVGFAFDQGWI